MLTVTERDMTEELTHEGIPVVSVSLKYPAVSGGTKRAAKRINRFYEHAAKALMKKIRRDMLPGAVSALRHNMEHGQTNPVWQASMRCRIAANSAAGLSLYRDIYASAGGARGRTTRYSETWDPVRGWLLDVRGFLPPKAKARRLLIDNAIRIAREQTAEGTHRYFENYPRLIRRHFDPENYFISGNAVCIFYDEYRIGPYSEGIPVFEYTPESANSSEG